MAADQRTRILILGGGFGGVYTARGHLRAFVRHSFHRGIVFLDGHGRSESRFAPFVLGFYPASAVLAVAALRRPFLVVPATTAVLSGAAGAFGVARGRTAFEVASLARIAPVYAAAHGAGMWRGLSLLVRDRFRAAR